MFKKGDLVETTYNKQVWNIYKVLEIVNQHRYILERINDNNKKEYKVEVSDNLQKYIVGILWC